MQLTELKADNHAVFQKIPDSFARLNQVNAVLYIENLAKISNTRIGDWDIVSTFREGDAPGPHGIPLLVTEKNEINRRFFTLKTTSPQVIADLPPDVTAKLMKIHTTTLERKRRALQLNIQNAIRNIDSYTNNINSQMTNLAGYREEERAFENVSNDTLLKNFAPLLTSAFWTEMNIDSDGGIISFATPEIELWEKNAAAGLNFGVNLGRFRGNFYVNERTFKITYIKDNTACGSYRHPHVSNEGNMCWGDTVNVAQKAMQDLDIVKLFETCRLVLTNYNAGNPFASLNNFWSTADVFRRRGTLGGISAESLQATELERRKKLAEVRAKSPTGSSTAQTGTPSTLDGGYEVITHYEELPL